MGIHFNTLALAIAHFQQMGWKPWLTEQTGHHEWKSAGFRKRYTDEAGTRSELFARFQRLGDSVIFVSVYDPRQLAA